MALLPGPSLVRPLIPTLVADRIRDRRQAPGELALGKSSRWPIYVPSEVIRFVWQDGGLDDVVS